MAKKARRKGSRRLARPTSPPGGAAAVRTPAAGRAVAPSGGAQALVRSVELSLGSQPAARRGPRSPLLLADPDPAIPLDRVPYLLKDLRNLALTAAAMVVLLFLGAQAIPWVIK